MKKATLYMMGTLLLTVLTFGASINVNAANTKTPSLSIPTVTSSQTEISGTATKNVNVYVKLNNEKQIAATTASKDGKYTIKLPKKYAVNTKLYIYAQAKDAYNYLYRIATVKSSSTATATNTTTSSNSSTTNTAKVNDLLGNWRSSASGKYTQLWTFNNTTGLDQTLYKNKLYDSKILSNAVYNVKSVNGNVITMTYRGKGIEKTSTMYIRLVNKKTFYLVDSNNKPVKLKVGNAPVATYKFTKIQ